MLPAPYAHLTSTDGTDRNSERGAFTTAQAMHRGAPILGGGVAKSGFAQGRPQLPRW